MNFSYSFQNKENIYSNVEQSTLVPLGIRCVPRLILDHFLIKCKYSLKSNFNVITPSFFNNSYIWPKDMLSIIQNGFISHELPTCKTFFPPRPVPLPYDNKFGFLISDLYNFWFKVEQEYNPNTVFEYYNECSNALKTLFESKRVIYFLIVNQDYLTSETWRTGAGHMFFEEAVEFDKKFQILFPNIRYKIIYMDFIKRTLPLNSNILLVHLQTDSLINNALTGRSPDVESYCSLLLNSNQTNNRKRLFLEGMLDVVTNTVYHSNECKQFREFCSNTLINLFFS